MFKLIDELLSAGFNIEFTKSSFEGARHIKIYKYFDDRAFCENYIIYDWTRLGTDPETFYKSIICSMRDKIEAAGNMYMAGR